MLNTFIYTILLMLHAPPLDLLFTNRAFLFHKLHAFYSSRSQVAPLKTIAISRLEQSVCLLLSKLVVWNVKSLKHVIKMVYLNSNSQIALAWIQIPLWKLKTFVVSHIAKIQGHIQNIHWKHISLNSNSTNLISCRLEPADLIINQLWWYGPNFLNQQNCTPESGES